MIGAFFSIALIVFTMARASLTNLNSNPARAPMKSIIKAGLGGRAIAALMSSIRNDRAWPLVVGYGFAIALVAAPLMRVNAGTPTQAGAEAAFLAENQAAMNRMMAGMELKPSGDIDRDFTAMMIPHHQGAVDMAQAELLYGHNETLRRIAQEIVVGQQREIVAMRQALGQPSPAPTGAPDQPAALADPAAGPSMSTMAIQPAK